MPQKLRYGCIGAGGIADKKHLNEYSKLPGVELVAVCDTNRASADRLAQKYNVPLVYDDYNEMFDKVNLDLVSVCTPNIAHLPITVAALEKGINVHCEKPIGLNAQEAAAIVDAKNKYGKKVMVALNNRFTSEADFVKKYAGFLGDIYHVKCGWIRRSGIPGKGMWFTNKQLSGGGPLIDLGVHFLDLVMYFMGFPEALSVTGATYTSFSNSSFRIRPGYKVVGDGIYDVEDMALGIVRLKNGCTVNFEFSWASNIEKETKYYELLGTKGGVIFSNGELKIFSEMLDTCINVVPELTAKPKSEFNHFIECIESNIEPLASPEQALKLMKLIDAIYLSAGEKREIFIS